MKATENNSSTTKSADVPPTLRLPPAREAHIDDLQRRYPTHKATLLPVLWEIQNEHGYISEPWMEYAAQRCGVTPAHVLSLVTFYTMLHRTPVGRHHIQICRNISCHIMGAKSLINAVEQRFDLRHGGVTQDGKLSLEHVECLAACSWAPVMQVNRTMHQNLTPAAAIKILEELP